MLTIYTDGGYSIAKNKGGWAVVITEEGKLIDTHNDILTHSTANRAELTAFIYALDLLQKDGSGKIFSDSRYVVIGYNNWMHKWNKEGWVKANGNFIKNNDLWKKVYNLYLNSIEVEWVRGHSTSEFNNLADSLTKV